MNEFVLNSMTERKEVGNEEERERTEGKEVGNKGERTGERK